LSPRFPLPLRLLTVDLDAAGWGWVDELPAVDLAYAVELLSTMIFKGIAFV